MKKYTVKKGKHDFKPRDFGVLPLRDWSKYEHVWKVQFLDTYDLGNKNQLDWCKGGGFTSYFSWNTTNTIMWAWRWNIERESFDICLYFNDKNGDHSWIEIHPLYKINKGDVVEITLKEERIPLLRNHEFIEDAIKFAVKPVLEVRIEGHDKTLKLEGEYPEDYRVIGWTRRTGLWFGGDEKAPSDIHIKSKYIKIKR